MDNYSILWPSGNVKNGFDFSECTEDLELGRLSSIIQSGMPPKEGLLYLASLATDDTAVIASRHEVIGDLIDNPSLIDVFDRVSKIAEDICFYSAGIRDNVKGLTSGDAAYDSMKKFIDGLEKLFAKNSTAMFDEQETNNYYAQFVRATLFTYENIKAYVSAVSLLKDALDTADYKSKALAGLKEWADSQYESDKIEASKGKLEEIEGWWKGIASFSVDVCISGTMDVLSLELSSINQTPYKRTGMLDRGAEEGYDGLTSLFSLPQSGTSALYQEFLMSELGISANKELQRLRKEVINLPLAGRETVISLGRELPFFTSAARLCIKLTEAGMPVCRPSFSDDAILDVRKAYMIELALLGGDRAVENDIYLPRGGTINLITGANSAGKTTYVITAGQLQWLFQMGYWLPCESARMGTVDAIYTLFASGESETGEDSRMGMEVIKIGRFKNAMSKRSLVLLNEPMTSTNAIEGIEICVDLLLDLISRDVSGMMVTHYNEIYSLCQDRLKGSGGRLTSYVMEVELNGGDIAYTYRVKQAPPGQSSHAQAVVSKLGVTLPDMLEKMMQKGIDINAAHAGWQKIHDLEAGA